MYVGTITTTVSDSNGLWTAIKNAHAGDTIALAPGNYSYESLANMNPSGMVTITSLDPSHPAVIAGLSVMGSSNLTFMNIEVTPKMAGGYAVTLGNDTNVHLEGVNIHASATVNGNAALIQNSKQVTIDGSDVHNISTGISFVNSDFVQLTNNKIHDIQSDGIHGGGTSDITISGNTFTNFAPKAGDHPDGIQFWTSGSTTSAHDIVITDNVISRGAGATFQGIFMGADPTLPFQNVTITGNAVVGGMYNGIALQSGDHVTIEHNLVEGYTDMTSWINASKTTNSVIDGNTTTSMNLGAGNVALNVHDNTIIPLAPIGDTTVLNAWLGTTPTGGGQALHAGAAPVEMTAPVAVEFDPAIMHTSLWSDTGFGML